MRESIAARPDFVILAYPLVSFVEGYTPGAFVGSTENFFGRRDVDDPRLVAAERRFAAEQIDGAERRRGAVDRDDAAPDPRVPRHEDRDRRSIP